MTTEYELTEEIHDHGYVCVCNANRASHVNKH